LLGKAVEGAKSLNDDKIAEYLRQNTIPTIMGPVKFGKNGEWIDSGMMQVQYKGIKGNDLEQFRGMDKQTIVAPPKFATGEAILPFEKAQQAQ
jgi:branched-chain amino acid transport system substrate-binding protein